MIIHFNKQLYLVAKLRVLRSNLGVNELLIQIVESSKEEWESL